MDWNEENLKRKKGFSPATRGTQICKYDGGIRETIGS